MGLPRYIDHSLSTDQAHCAYTYVRRKKALIVNVAIWRLTYVACNILLASKHFNARTLQLDNMQ